jgi:glycine/D-amino acid oxidase-like deaminating enzyme
MNEYSTWQKGIDLPAYPALKGDLQTEVVIIGGGIVGSVTAYRLARAGKKVVVLEKGTLLESSSTAYTTGMLGGDVDTDLGDLIYMFGEKKAKLVWKSGQDAIDSIEENIKREKIDCEFIRVPEYWYATSAEGYDAFKEEAAQAKEFGFKVKKVSDETLPFKHAGAFAYENQGKYHPLKYLGVLRAKAVELGAVFHEHTEALDIEGDTTITVKTSHGIVTADAMIMATYQPFQNPLSLFAMKGFYETYTYELAIPKGSLPEACYLDDANPYHFFRVDAGDKEDRMLIGGEDHRKELPIDPEKNYAALREYLAVHFPDLKYRIVNKWGGSILESVDGLPFIGRYDKQHPNRYVATAFSGNGMTHGHTAAEIFTSYITGTKNEYAELYNPLRKKITIQELRIKTRDYVGEFFGGYLKNIFRSTNK